MKQVFEHAVTTAGRIPDLVLTGHVHNYQRFTLPIQGREVPFIVAGAGGYKNLHAVLRVNGERIHTPFRIPDSEAMLERYTDDRHGFLRLIVTRTRLGGRYYAVPRTGFTHAERMDTFTLDLQSHRLLH